eukprot:GILK01008614.1.p1 GENE.GILK01008614.1~~GILK01008614.1.p1  ORF type:complete len:198 (-),score=29.96 GILK01008614.1:297-890(-)
MEELTLSIEAKKEEHQRIRNDLAEMSRDSKSLEDKNAELRRALKESQAEVDRLLEQQFLLYQVLKGRELMDDETTTMKKLAIRQVAVEVEEYFLDTHKPKSMRFVTKLRHLIRHEHFDDMAKHSLAAEAATYGFEALSTLTMSIQMIRNIGKQHAHAHPNVLPDMPISKLKEYVTEMVPQAQPAFELLSKVYSQIHR